ncbi:MAG: hypothetical protein RIT81_32125 [Deltaproteobacteria bacterium]
MSGIRIAVALVLAGLLGGCIIVHRGSASSSQVFTCRGTVQQHAGRMQLVGWEFQLTSPRAAVTTWSAIPEDVDLGPDASEILLRIDDASMSSGRAVRWSANARDTNGRTFPVLSSNPGASALRGHVCG